MSDLEEELEELEDRVEDVEDALEDISAPVISATLASLEDRILALEVGSGNGGAANLDQIMAQLQSIVNAVTGLASQVNSLGGRVTDLEANGISNVTQQQLESIATTLATIGGKLSGLGTRVNRLEAQAEVFDTRDVGFANSLQSLLRLVNSL